MRFKKNENRYRPRADLELCCLYLLDVNVEKVSTLWQFCWKRIKGDKL